MNIVSWRMRDADSTFRYEFDQLFNRFFEPTSQSNLPVAFRTATSPPVDVAETEEN